MDGVLNVTNVAQDKNKNLLESISLGNLQAEHDLVDKYYKTLFYILFKQTKDQSLAQDLCQDTFVIVLQKARNGEINNTNAVGAFIRSVGINLLIEFKRKKTRQKTESSESVEQLFASQQDNLVSNLEKKQAIQLVQQVIQELNNERDRHLIRDYFLYGKPKASICEAFDLKAEHFDRVLYRARQRLKQLLAHKLDIDTASISVTNIICITLLCTVSGIFIFTMQKDEEALRDSFASHHCLDRTISKIDDPHVGTCLVCVRTSV